MSDLISRRLAIDAMLSEFKRVPTTAIRAKDVLEKLPSAEPEQQWIPVTERLPEATVSVIVTSTNGHVYTSRIVSGEWEYGGNVTAWMPLPEPWNGGKK